MTTRHPLASDLDHVLSHTCDLWEELRDRRIFITGATGFFGCWLLESFVRANEHLRLNAEATILTRNPQHLEERLPHLANRGLRVVVGDVRNFAFPNQEFSHIIHAATESSAVLNATQPELMFDTIVEGTRHCLDLAALNKASKFLFTSSGAVYGMQPAHLTHVPEDFTGGPDPTDTNSAYGEGKRASELLCAVAAKRSGLQAKIARCFAFVGPYMKMDAHFAIGNFIRDRIKGDPICVRGDGTAVRSYMYASDLMIWLWTILFRGESCRPYNVGSEDGISIAELAREVTAVDASRGETLSRPPVQIQGMRMPGAPAARYVPSTARAQTELGLRCSVSLNAAIKRTVAWNRLTNAAELQTQ
jgi:nucleoside-diphosphate-sugar epimerase